MRLFISGTAESGKDALVELVLNGYRNALKGYSYISFDDIIRRLVGSGRIEFGSTLSEIKEFESSFSEQLEKADGKLVINGYFCADTPHGYVPLISRRLFKELSPNLIILFEEDIRIMRKSLAASDPVRKLLREQEMNRIWAHSLAAETGSIVKTIKVSSGNVKESLREFADVLRFVSR